MSSTNGKCKVDEHILSDILWFAEKLQADIAVLNGPKSLESAGLRDSTRKRTSEQRDRTALRESNKKKKDISDPSSSLSSNPYLEAQFASTKIAQERSRNSDGRLSKASRDSFDSFATSSVSSTLADGEGDTRPTTSVNSALVQASSIPNSRRFTFPRMSSFQPNKELPLRSRREPTTSREEAAERPPKKAKEDTLSIDKEKRVQLDLSQLECGIQETNFREMALFPTTLVTMKSLFLKLEAMLLTTPTEGTPRLTVSARIQSVRNGVPLPGSQIVVLKKDEEYAFEAFLMRIKMEFQTWDTELRAEQGHGIVCRVKLAIVE